MSARQRKPTPAPMPITPEERPGLQALLRGCNEGLALLPETSPRFRTMDELAAGLVDMLTRDDVDA